MYRALMTMMIMMGMMMMMMMTIAGTAVVGDAVAPENDFSTKKVRQLELVEVENNKKAPVYTNQQQANFRAPHFYPTYPEYNGKSIYAVQSGIDGFFIPVDPPKEQGWTTSIMSTLVPLSSYALSYGARAGAFIWNLLLLLLAGGVLTTSICTFTPFCTITFLGFGINKNQVRDQVTELARTYITPESMNAATLLVKRAIDEYAELQRQLREEEEKTKNEKKEEKRRRR